MSIRASLCIVFVLIFTACSHTPDEQRIRMDIDTMRQAIEERRPRDFMEFVAADFTGNDGTVDREGLHNILRGLALRNDAIGIVLSDITVQLQGTRATVKLVATFTGSAGGPIPDHAAIYTITSGWKKQGSDWRCNNATWEQQL